MTNEQKIIFADRVSDLMQQYVTSDDMPIMIGTLIKPQGINGFQRAEEGHPVFEYRDRYIIYLESTLPERYKVAVPYYKETLKPIIKELSK